MGVDRTKYHIQVWCMLVYGILLFWGQTRIANTTRNTFSRSEAHNDAFSFFFILIVVVSFMQLLYISHECMIEAI